MDKDTKRAVAVVASFGLATVGLAEELYYQTKKQAAPDAFQQPQGDKGGHLPGRSIGFLLNSSSVSTSGVLASQALNAMTGQPIDLDVLRQWISIEKIGDA
ncbi:MAG: hypothetical protein IT562_08485 [Alphaproteobacteria bacterium]|nr:hypothetical protein [Alphaproteobacteria bacterium]